MIGARTRLVLIPAALGLLALGIAGCGGDDDDDNGTETPETTTTTGRTETATSAAGGSATPGASETPGGDDGDDEGLLERLRESATDSEPETFKSVYRMSSAELEGTFTIISLPPRSLFSIEGENAGAPVNFSLIQDEEYNYICSEEGGTGQCLQTPATDESLLGGFGDLLTFDAREQLLAMAEEEGVEIDEIDGRTVAGQDAECYEFSGPDGDGVACLGEESGRLLLVEATEDGAPFTYELVEFSDSPDESEFEPPFPVTTMGG